MPSLPKDLSITPANKTEQVQRIASLAQIIWSEHFTDIIGADQVAYMLRTFQSTSAINIQIQQGVDYYLVEKDHIALGYLAVIPQQERVQLSKLYLLDSYRGSGVGAAMLHFVEHQYKERTLWLTVNKYNHQSIEWYQRRGLVISDAIKKDIGEGFFMDDYIMEKMT